MSDGRIQAVEKWIVRCHNEDCDQWYSQSYLPYHEFVAVIAGAGWVLEMPRVRWFCPKCSGARIVRR